MMSRTKALFPGGLVKSKNIHSVDYLKYLYTLLNKNQNVTEQNRELLIEVFRLIAEILIWGDQNDSSVIDFFLEKNILSYFLSFMRHKNGKLICNQLLQTLSIMFENISDNTSIYYLLSNNHINSIICHKFDFSDEEVMAYYISFLKALSMKLNKHTINFFYNEHTDDFALYTEAIKFFNQSESMVRTAVRVITLNVYKVADKPMLKYIRQKTAGPYFRSLVWSIGNQVLEIDACLQRESEQIIECKLQTFVDEHLDNLHYINDILCLNVEILNEILIDCLLNKLIIPLYIYSLTKRRPYTQETDRRPHITYSLAMFLLAQIFVIIKRPEVVQPLSEILLTGDISCCFSDSCSSEADDNEGNNGEGNDEGSPITPRPTCDAENNNENDNDDNDGDDGNVESGVSITTGTPVIVNNIDVAHDDGIIADDNKLVESVKTDAENEGKEEKEEEEEEEEKAVQMRINHYLQGKLERGFDLKIESLSKLLEKVKGSPRPRSNEHKASSADECDSDTEQVPTDPEMETKTNRGVSYQSAPVTPRLRHQSSSCERSQPPQATVTAGVEMANNSLGENGKIIPPSNQFSLEAKPFLKTIFRCLSVDDSNPINDYDALFSLCFLFTLCQNQGVPEDTLTDVGLTSKSTNKRQFNKLLMEKFIEIFNACVQYGSTIRLVTVELVCILIEILVCSREESFITDDCFASILTAREESTLLLRNYYKTEAVFVDMFEEECMEMQKRPLNVEFLMMDSHILLPSTSKLLDTVDFSKRLPKNDAEKAKYSIRVFLLLRQLCERIKTDHDEDEVMQETETTTNTNTTASSGLWVNYPFNMKVIRVGDTLDLATRELVACTVTRYGKTEKRFLVTDEQQVLLVEPDSKRVGWGVVLFSGFLQHVKLTAVREDSKSLFVNIYDHKGAITLKTTNMSVNPILSGKFSFDDHIRCMVAQRRLERGRDSIQEAKLRHIATLLDFPANVVLAIKPNHSSNSNREYRSGYYGPNRRDSGSHSSDRSSSSSKLTTTNSRSNSSGYRSPITGTKVAAIATSTKQLSAAANRQLHLESEAAELKK